MHSIYEKRSKRETSCGYLLQSIQRKEMTKLGVDIDGDKKPDFHLDIKTLLMAIGMIVSVAMSYSVLKSEIEVAKTLPKPLIEQDDTRVVNQKIEWLIKEFERQDERLKDIEKIAVSYTHLRAH